MKTTILVDTGIIVQYLKTGKGILPTAYEKYTMVISAATYAELLASKTFQDENLEKEVLDFVDKYFTIRDVSKKIAHEAARIMRVNEVSFAAACVAATGLSEGIQLLTEDKKTFNKIGGLELMDM